MPTSGRTCSRPSTSSRASRGCTRRSRSWSARSAAGRTSDAVLIARRLLLAVFALLLAVDGAQARPWGWLGVRIRDLSEQEMEDISRRHGIREGFGVLIVEVMADTPAARAGMKNGDLVVAFNERPVVDSRMLQRLIASAPLAEEATVTVLRPEIGRRAITVRLALMPADVAGDRVAAEFGFLVRDPGAEGELGGRRPVGAAPSVSVVAKGSRAEEAGLRVGD